MMRRLFTYHWLRFLPVLFLGGCSLLPIQKTSTENALKPVHYQGRFIIYKTDSHLSQTTDIPLAIPLLGRFEWIDTGKEAYSLEISDYLNQTQAVLRVNSEGATLQLPRKPELAIAQPEAVLRRQIGVDLPFKLLRYWLQGKASPSTARTYEFSQQQLNQLGWQISYEGAPAQDPFLFKTIELFHRDSEGGNTHTIKVRLTIDQRSST